jgi:hypothetical protein
MKESDYQFFLDTIKGEEKTLKEISQKFFEMTSETKRILDEVREKSDNRKEAHGVKESDG